MILFVKHQVFLDFLAACFAASGHNFALSHVSVPIDIFLEPSNLLLEVGNPFLLGQHELLEVIVFPVNILELQSFDFKQTLSSSIVTKRHTLVV